MGGDSSCCGDKGAFHQSGALLASALGVLLDLMTRVKVSLSEVTVF